MVHYPVIPPYLLERLVQLAPPAVRQSAAQTLRVDMTLRPPSRAVPRAPPAATGKAVPQRAIHDAAQGMRLPGVLVRAEGAPASTCCGPTIGASLRAAIMACTPSGVMLRMAASTCQGAVLGFIENEVPVVVSRCNTSSFHSSGACAQP